MGSADTAVVVVPFERSESKAERGMWRANGFADIFNEFNQFIGDHNVGSDND
jgi:hypothetical protein